MRSRRLEASLVADAVVADLEIQMRKGVAPVIERNEWTSDEEQFVIRVQNRTIEEALAAPATTLAEEATGESPDPISATPRSTQIGGAGGIGAMLAGELPEVAKHLRQYDVEVAYREGGGPASVTRTTFAFDWNAAKTEYAALFEAGGGEGLEDGGQNGANGTTPALADPKALPSLQGNRDMWSSARNVFTRTICSLSARAATRDSAPDPAGTANSLERASRTTFA